MIKAEPMNPNNTLHLMQSQPDQSFQIAEIQVITNELSLNHIPNTQDDDDNLKNNKRKKPKALGKSCKTVKKRKNAASAAINSTEVFDLIQSEEGGQTYELVNVQVITDAMPSTSTKGSKKIKGEGKDMKMVEKDNRKLSRELGKSYKSLTRKKDEAATYAIREERKLGPGCASKVCAASKTHKCNEISEMKREKLFNSFWKELNWDQKQMYVVSLIIKKGIIRKDETVKSRRNWSLKYHLLIDNERVAVCKTMFLTTLGLGESQVLNWVRKTDENGIIMKQKTKSNQFINKRKSNPT